MNTNTEQNKIPPGRAERICHAGTGEERAGDSPFVCMYLPVPMDLAKITY